MTKTLNGTSEVKTTSGTLPQTVELLKALELNALKNRRITAEDCKHLTSDEIVMALLEML